MSCLHVNNFSDAIFYRARARERAAEGCECRTAVPIARCECRTAGIVKGAIMINFTIRPVEKTDLDAVTAVEAICFPAAEAATRESFEQRIAAFPECFFVAEYEGKIIGFINGCATDECTIRDEMFEDSSLHNPNGCYQSIFGLDVIPEYQRQGIAAELMNHLIEDARIKGRKGLILTCKDRLIHYYAKFGYELLGLSESVHGGAVWYDMILKL